MLNKVSDVSIELYFKDGSTVSASIPISLKGLTLTLETNVLNSLLGGFDRNDIETIIVDGMEVKWWIKL